MFEPKHIIGFLTVFVSLSSGLEAEVVKKDAPQLLVAGIEVYKAGQYQKAIEEFSKAAMQSPDDADIPFYIGLSYQRLNQPDKAMEAFYQTIAIDPAFIEAHYQLGLFLIQQKNFGNAILHLEIVHE